MHLMQPGTLVCLLLFSAQAGAATDFAYQWSDEQGLIHYGDKPPSAENVTTITLPGHPESGGKTRGLRPGERTRLDNIEQQQLQQESRSRATRAHTDKQRSALRNQCRSHREKMKHSTGRDAFKQHARFLRNNCW